MPPGCSFLSVVKQLSTGMKVARMRLFHQAIYLYLDLIPTICTSRIVGILPPSETARLFGRPSIGGRSCFSGPCLNIYGHLVTVSQIHHLPCLCRNLSIIVSKYLSSWRASCVFWDLKACCSLSRFNFPVAGSIVEATEGGCKESSKGLPRCIPLSSSCFSMLNTCSTILFWKKRPLQLNSKLEVTGLTLNMLNTSLRFAW